MHRFVHHNTTDSIHNLVDMYSFRTEELVIGLSELEILVPDSVDQNLPVKMNGTGIYNGDEIKPKWLISNQDNFFLKTPEGMKEINPTNLKSSENVYFTSPLFRLYDFKQKYAGVQYFFGPWARFSPSIKAMRKMVAAQTLVLFLKQQSLHSFSSELGISPLETLYPPSNVNAWLEHMLKNSDVPKRPATNHSFYNQHPPEYWEEMEGNMPCEIGFHFKLLDHLGANMVGIFKEIDRFLDAHRDCLHTIELQGERLAIVRGIDHKYIPYYEKKFKNDDQT